jgi:hypothetical protein
MAPQQTYPCSKCDGSGTLRAFANIQNGICFRCGGTGTQTSKPRKQTIKPFTAYQQTLYDRLMSETFLENASYKQLSILRDFAHWDYPCCPQLFTIWFERGEHYFQAKQEERLTAFST